MTEQPEEARAKPKGLKARHSQHGETKTEKIFVRVTPTAKQGLENQSVQKQISVAELIERLGRGELPSFQLPGESCAS